MNQKKENIEEHHVFEFYDEERGSFADIDESEISENYNIVDFRQDLNDQQLEIVNNLNGPMLVIAGAGSGKTRTIVYSVAKLLLSGVKPGEIMLVTFTNKAANEMVKRVELLLGKKPKGMWAGTFHSIANRFLRIYSEKAGLKPNYTIMDQSDAKALMKLSIDSANLKEINERFPKAAMVKDILSYSINCNLSIREVVSWKYYQFDSDKVIMKINEVHEIYSRKKAGDGLLDFDDLLVFWNRLLDEKFVARLIARKIKYVLVDEYQDTNFIQDEIIQKIVSQNPDRNVLAVGDDAQSIYAFRGANFKNIINFKNKYKGCRVFKITYNYRSTPEILELANDSIRHNKHQYKKRMRATRSGGILPFQVSVGTEEDQARFISNQILNLRTDGYDLKDMAILYRATHHSMKIELELQAKNIPYEVRAGLAFFERVHIKDLLAHLRIIDNPHNEISWSRLFSIIPGLGTRSGAKIFQMISNTENPTTTILENDFFSSQMKGSRIPHAGKENLIAHVNYFVDYGSEDSPSEVISDIIKLITNHVKLNYKDWENRIDDLKQLSIYAQNYPSIRKFLESLSLNLSSIESRVVKAGKKSIEEHPLVLSTIHRAKGLEWRVVFIPMLCDDHFPSSRVIAEEEAFEEERRVFYVGLTRAKDQLYLLSPAVIQSFSGIQAAKISTFVSELQSRMYKKATVNFLVHPEENYLSPREEKPQEQFVSAFSLINKEKSMNNLDNNVNTNKSKPKKKHENNSLNKFLRD